MGTDLGVTERDPGVAGEVVAAAPRRAPRVSRRRLLSRLARGLLAGGAILATGPSRALAQPFEPFWVQAHVFTELWSGPDRTALSFGIVPRWSYFTVVAPGPGARLYVWSPYSGNYAYVDASAVGPVGPPPAEALARPLSRWIANDLPTTLWSGRDQGAIPLGQIAKSTAFEILGLGESRLRVRDPRTDGHAYLDAAVVNRIDPPSGPLRPTGRWWGTVGAPEANVRAAAMAAADALGEVEKLTPVVVQGWVAGEEVLPDQPTWARLADDVFIYSPLLRPAPIEHPPTPPANAPRDGRWIDANLTHQVAVAYDGVEPVYLARFSSGRPGWETSTGVFRITRRVANETMDSSSLLGIDAARASYRIQGIKWTQYFTADGQAIHHNYWRDPDLFGIPSSHGCLGMLEPDARWFWDWASTGTPLVIHD